MTNRMVSALVVGAFATALGSFPVSSAGAAEMKPMSKADIMKMSEMTASETKSGKMEKCYRVALKG